MEKLRIKECEEIVAHLEERSSDAVILCEDLTEWLGGCSSKASEVASYFAQGHIQTMFDVAENYWDIEDFVEILQHRGWYPI